MGSLLLLPPLLLLLLPPPPLLLLPSLQWFWCGWQNLPLGGLQIVFIQRAQKLPELLETLSYATAL